MDLTNYHRFHYLRLGLEYQERVASSGNFPSVLYSLSLSDSMKRCRSYCGLKLLRFDGTSMGRQSLAGEELSRRRCQAGLCAATSSTWRTETESRS